MEWDWKIWKSLTNLGVVRDEEKLIYFVSQFPPEVVYDNIKYLTSEYDNTVIPTILEVRPDVLRLIESDPKFSHRLIAAARVQEKSQQAQYIIDACRMRGQTVEIIAQCIYDLPLAPEDLGDLPEDVMAELLEVIRWHSKYDDPYCPLWDLIYGGEI